MPSVLEKIRILGEQSKYDICASTASSRSQYYPNLFGDAPNSIGRTASGGICHSYTPDGRCVSLFKVLFTNKCIYSCQYCSNTTCKQKVGFSPEEYARTFMKLYSMNVLEGLFMSSGVCGDADETTKQMLEAVKLLRFKYHFQGYIHFKCLPGTSAYLLREAIQLSDRISINLEAPTKQFLSEIASQKNYNTDLITRQRWLKEIRNHHNYQARKHVNDVITDLSAENRLKFIEQNPWFQAMQIQQEVKNSMEKSKDTFEIPRKENGYVKIRWDSAPILNSGQTTQFVLGATEESDYDLLKRLDWEYREIDLRRGYFSAFSPIKGTPLERHIATPLDREHRLYQTDWLLRLYNFKLPEIKNILNAELNLPAGDPKKHLAKQFFEDKRPIDPNTASRQELLRIPGIGLKSVQRILNLRYQKIPITKRSQLKAMGVVLKWADPYLCVNGQTQHTLEKYRNLLPFSILA